MHHCMFLEWPQNTTKSLSNIDNIFHVHLMRGFQKYARNWILIMAFGATYLQNSTANSVHLAVHFSTVWVCPQKATVQIQFLSYFWNPLIKYLDMKNVVKSSKYFFGYFNTLETHSEVLRAYCPSIYTVPPNFSNSMMKIW